MRHQIITIICLLTTQTLWSQSPDTTLTLPAALRIVIANYPRIKAAQNLANASALELKAARQDGLPDLTAGAQLAYGTLDGLNGHGSGEPGLTTLTNGPATTSQNWNAAFGALYLTNAHM